MRQELTDSLSIKIKEALTCHRIPLWMLAFSGNGLHLHFKLTTPYQLNSIRQYKNIYDSLRGYLECITGLKFDPSCSNPSRLIRLPLSTNWKDLSAPVSCLVLGHDPSADFSQVFASFKDMIEFKPLFEKKHLKDKQRILQSLKLENILDHFAYSKKDSITDQGNRIVCSSPFASDSNPSFYYDKERKLFYDFSQGVGGDLFSLIARLAGLDNKADFVKILELSAKITGIQLADNKEAGFKLDSKGVWYQSNHDAELQWLATPIYVEALTRDANSNSWGRLLTFRDQDKVEKTWSMPMELLAGDGSEIRRHLLNLGVEMATTKKERQLLLSYLQSTRPNKRAQSVKRTGWHLGQFVLPNKVISSGGESLTKLILQTKSHDNSFSSLGTIDEWKTNIGEFCVGNSRLIFAVSCAFASVLLKLTGEESGGFHFVGSSSIGKSITLKVAASVWGDPGLSGFVKRWRSTLNGLELIASSRCDSLLILDELGEIPAQEAGNAAYMLSGGVSKNRATKDTTLAEQQEWRILFLSSGEITLASYIASSGQKINVGQEVRMIDLPAEAQSSLGVFENILR